MPRLDGTGPMGMGPMTGRGSGRCGGYRAGRPLRGRGMGLGYRIGCRRTPYEYGVASNAYRLSPEEEKEMLLREKELLEAQLEAIEKEIED